ncbi:hypothetical protein SGLAM104S_03397 [Streptomyces glaucescens]
MTITAYLSVNHRASWTAGSSSSREKLATPLPVKPSMVLPWVKEYPSDHTIGTSMISE